MNKRQTEDQTENQTETMKTQFARICTTLLLATSLWLNAAEPDKPKKGSPEFERLKTLVGTWTGKCDMGQGPVDITLHYRMVAGGSVLEERCFAGTPNEMVTMYYDENGKLAMTHYCMLGNRPVMKLKSSDARMIKFNLDASCCIELAKESHMHALSITFDDKDTITTSCEAVIDGKEMPAKSTTLKRARS